MHLRGARQIVWSVPIVSTALAAVWQPIVERPFDVIERGLLRCCSILRTDADDPLRPPGPIKWYMRGMVPVMGYVHFVACLGTALLCWALGGSVEGAFANSLAAEGDGRLGPFDALYVRRRQRARPRSRVAA